MIVLFVVFISRTLRRALKALHTSEPQTPEKRDARPQTKPRAGAENHRNTSDRISGELTPPRRPKPAARTSKPAHRSGKKRELIGSRPPDGGLNGGCRTLDVPRCTQRFIRARSPARSGPGLVGYRSGRAPCTTRAPCSRIWASQQSRWREGRPSLPVAVRRPHASAREGSIVGGERRPGERLAISYRQRIVPPRIWNGLVPGSPFSP